MAAAIAQSAPKTPTKKDNAGFQDVINKLNTEYNLGIELFDYKISPAKHRESVKTAADLRCAKICRQLRAQFFSRDSLDHILSTFDHAAKETQQHWVRKPLADQDTLPTTTNPPRASTSSEREELQLRLISILAQSRAAVLPPIPFGPIQRSPNACQETSKLSSETTRGSCDIRPSRAPSKRRSGDRVDDSSPKRTKAQPENEQFNRHVAGTIDHVPVRPKVAGAARIEGSGLYPTVSTRLSGMNSCLLDQPNEMPFVVESANTSKLSIQSTVFSIHDEDPTVSTQTTIEASSQEQKQDIELRNKSLEFLPSSGHIRSFHESFSENETLSINGVETTDAGVNQRASSPDRDTVYSSIRGWSDIVDAELASSPRSADESDLASRLASVWPKFPSWLRSAPLAVAWEVTRIALHCGVNLDDVEMKYSSTWSDQKNLRAALWNHFQFRGKAFPASSSSEAWSASLSDFRLNGSDVVLSASMDFNADPTGPAFKLKLHPLQIDLSYRLSRRFGPDRFFELLFPSPSSWNVPAWLKNDYDAIEAIKTWLTDGNHSLCGRHWAAFYTKEAGYRKPTRELRLGPEPKPVWKDRLYFFAEDGVGFTSRPSRKLPSEKEPPHMRTKLDKSQMLDWALELNKNVSQPYLKLFQRIALVLSKTTPTIVFTRAQIRNGRPDLRSPTGKVMNDGVGRMSRNVALMIRDKLGLTDIPCAIQGRVGSAKGMWIIDVTDSSDEIWIETYESQEKWVTSWDSPEHRTLEVRSHAVELRPARFNLQLLPVLEDRALDKTAFHKEVGKFLQENLQRDLDGLKSSMNNPLRFRQWIDENSSRRQERLRHGYVPYLGGLPDGDEETMIRLLDAGFDPRKQRFLQDMAWNLQKAKCETLAKKLNIKIGMSAYAYMVIDFQGLLEEDEVHFSFSSKFQAEGFSDTLLDGIDVLVARSPAHYVSDIQKVRAVFKPQLRALKDVIVFSSKGNTPLAEKLSGGDYDGDLAWVCWDPRIVDNFRNAEVPAAPDLFRMGYLRKNQEAFNYLYQNCDLQTAVSRMITESFKFNMEQNLLGQCTNYKERLCYKRQNVNDEAAVLLSTLLSHLVDQAKQGTIFSTGDFSKLLKFGLKEPRDLPEPAYKGDKPPMTDRPTNIIDYLKFTIAKPAIQYELAALHRDLKSNETNSPEKLFRSPGSSRDKPEDNSAHYWDKDLAVYYDDWEEMAKTSPSAKALFQALKQDLENMEKTWKVAMSSDSDFPEKIKSLHDEWMKIQPRVNAHKALENSKMVAMLLQHHLNNPELSQWALLRASVAFKIFYNLRPNLVWRLAGWQLAHIKALKNWKAGNGSAPVLVAPEMYAALKPDNKYITKVVARMRGEGSDYIGDEDISDVEEDDA